MRRILWLLYKIYGAITSLYDKVRYSQIANI
nr:MAG TPA: hypothetical protein [Caudoviricetes sp.]